MIFRFLLTFILFAHGLGIALAHDEILEVNKARAFPVQKNNTVIKGSKNEADGDESVAVLNPSIIADKAPSKDTTLIVNGNGGSTNRAAGGNASIRKRFTFD